MELYQSIAERSLNPVDVGAGGVLHWWYHDLLVIKSPLLPLVA